jgi:hypothetical protein
MGSLRTVERDGSLASGRRFGGILAEFVEDFGRR